MRNVSLLLAIYLLAACGQPKGRVKEGDEGDLVGSRTAGAGVAEQAMRASARPPLASARAMASTSACGSSPEIAAIRDRVSVPSSSHSATRGCSRVKAGRQ
jgi:hypothetical protein